MIWYCSPLEKRSALEVILQIHKRPGLTKTEVMRLPVGPEEKAPNEKTRFQRINELIDLGVIEVRNVGPQWNSTGLYLTEEGERLAKQIESMNRVMRKLQTASSENHEGRRTTPQDRCFGLLDVDEDTAGELMSQCPVAFRELGK